MKQILFFLILILVISACTNSEELNDNPDVTQPNNNDEILFECNNLDLIQEGLAITYPRYDCYIDVAVKEKNVDICELIKSDFKFECYSRVGIESGDILICNKLQNNVSKEVCYKGVAVTNLDESICEIIMDETTEAKCYLELSVYSTNLELCDNMNLKAYFFAECKKNIAINSDDELICEDIGISRFKDECFLELNVCSKISNLELNQKCLSFDIDLSECENSKNSDLCMYGKATEMLNPIVCSRVTNTALKYECYRDIAVDNQDSTICDNMQLGSSVLGTAGERAILKCNDDVMSGTKDSTFN